MQQNERQLPRLSTDTGGVLSHQYGYDNNGNVTQTQDLARGAHYHLFDFGNRWCLNKAPHILSQA